MAEPEEGLERDEKYHHGEENTGERREPVDRAPIFHKQPERRNRNGKPCSKRALEHREHALAFGCNFSRRCEHNNR